MNVARARGIAGPSPLKSQKQHQKNRQKDTRIFFPDYYDDDQRSKSNIAVHRIDSV